MDHAVPSPLTARRAGAAQGRLRVPGRQVDLAPRPDLRRARGRRDPHLRAARGRGRASTPPRPCARSARRSSAPARAPGACTASASAALREPAGALDFGNSGTGCRLVMGAVGGLPDHRDLRRRRLAAQAADAAHARSARADGRARRSSAAEGGRLPITLAGARDPIPIVYRTPGAVGADQVGGAAGRPRRAGRNHRDRDAKRRATTPRRCSRISAPRSRSTPEGAHGRRITLDGPARARARAGRGAGRSVLGRVPAGGGADRAGLRGRSSTACMTNPLRTGLLDDAARDGRRHRGAGPAQRGRRGGRRSARARLGAAGRRGAGRRARRR